MADHLEQAGLVAGEDPVYVQGSTCWKRVSVVPSPTPPRRGWRQHVRVHLQAHVGRSGPTRAAPRSTLGRSTLAATGSGGGRRGRALRRTRWGATSTPRCARGRRGWRNPHCQLAANVAPPPSGPVRPGGPAPTAAGVGQTRSCRRRWSTPDVAGGERQAGGHVPPASIAGELSADHLATPNRSAARAVSSPEPHPRSAARRMPSGPGCTRSSRSKNGRLRSKAKRWY